MDVIDWSVAEFFQPFKSSFVRRNIIGLSDGKEGAFLRIDEGGLMCAHALENFIQIYTFSQFNIKRSVEQTCGAVFMNSLKEGSTKCIL